MQKTVVTRIRLCGLLAVACVLSSATLRALPDSPPGNGTLTGTVTDSLGAPIFDATYGCADDDFADGHHLLPQGAAKFAAKFKQDVLQPFLARNSQPASPFADELRAELAERPKSRIQPTSTK